MSIRTIIVDDVDLARERIKMLLDNTEFEIVAECANGREAIKAISSLRPDLVFLDIQMPKIGGFEVVETIGAEEMPAVIFVTAYDEFALRAFEINAVDYLLKPVDAERFEKTLNRVREEIKNEQVKNFDRRLSALLRDLESAKSTDGEPVYLERVTVKEAGRITFVEVEDIDWILSEGNYIQLHAKRKTHLLRETMDGIERKLDPKKFVRLRRSTIVRISRIKELHPLFNGEFAVVLKDGTKLSSSRRYRQNIDALLKSWR